MSFSDDEIGNNMNQNQNNSSTITDELTLQIAHMLRNGLGIQQTQSNLDNLSIGFKLNGDNYLLWATLMKKLSVAEERRVILQVYLWHQKR